jgi:hypothetical protein
MIHVSRQIHMTCKKDIGLDDWQVKRQFLFELKTYGCIVICLRNLANEINMALGCIKESFRARNVLVNWILVDFILEYAIFAVYICIEARETMTKAVYKSYESRTSGEVSSDECLTNVDIISDDLLHLSDRQVELFAVS